MSYVDGFVLPLPKKNVAAYRRMSKQAGKVWRELGALEYRECIGDDIDTAPCVPFGKHLKLKRGETAVFAWIRYSSRAHRDRVNKAVMGDPRILRMMKQKPPFDAARMVYGGFKAIVEV